MVDHFVPGPRPDLRQKSSDADRFWFGRQLSNDGATEFVRLASRCLQSEPQERPNSKNIGYKDDGMINEALYLFN